MERLKERLGFPIAHYRLHRAITEGLPLALLAQLADEMDIPEELLSDWLPGGKSGHKMSVATGEIFYRLVHIVEALQGIYGEDKSGIVGWLTTPKIVLANEVPIDLITTAMGGRAVLQLLIAQEYGLPV